MTTREIFREIGVILIGFMIYDSIYRPWSPKFTQFFPGVDSGEDFTLTKAIAILSVCATIFVVFWSYDVAFRSKESFAELQTNDNDEWVAPFGYFTGFVINAMRIAVIFYFIRYVASIAILSLFAWLALGTRQAFCVFLGTVCILDMRKIWGSGFRMQP